MTSIDRAFQKAYAKRVPSLDEGESDGKTDRPVWLDQQTESMHRIDKVHPVPAPHQALVAASWQASEAVVGQGQETPPVPVADLTPGSSGADSSKVESVKGDEAETSAATESEPAQETTVNRAEQPQAETPVPKPDAAPPKIQVHTGTTAYEAWSQRLESLETSRRDRSRASLKSSKPKAFNPVWEVDAFHIPEVVSQMVAGPLDSIGEQLRRASGEGLQTLAICSQHRGAGRSCLSIALAQSASDSGMRVALVDGDIDSPSLVEYLKLDVESDWIDCINAGQSIEEAAVLSVENKFSLIPLLSKTPEKLGRVDQQAKLLTDRLRHHFDLVVLDYGPLNPGSFGQSIPINGDLIDAVILIENMQRTQQAEVDATARQIRALGIDNVGLIENFVAETNSVAA